MPTYITLDAGGTKCNAILFDNDMRILGRGLSGGVNVTQTSPEDSRANIISCLNQLFSQTLPERIECIYLSFVGPVSVLMDELKARTYVESYELLGEARAGMLAGGLRHEGLLAIAGTGSDVFYVADNTDEIGHGKRLTVGGWGPILGDQGSGTWIGQQALRALVKAYDGWGVKTCLNQLAVQEWGIGDEWDLVGRIHGSVAPFRTVASFAPLVGRASRMGDEVARRIITDAGELMAEQCLCLLGRVDIPPENRHLVCCGGAWKIDPLMYDTFAARLGREAPQIEVSKPCFEHVMAGPVLQLLNAGTSREDALNKLKAHFGDYIIHW